MIRRLLTAALTLAVATPGLAQTRPDQIAFRGLYKELVETNTTLSAGDCTIAANRMAARLKAAGFGDGDLTVYVPTEQPKRGGLVAKLPGTDPHAKAILLLAHIDVVEAKREDWTRDPFTLIEEGGYFYARGSSDDKAQASIYTDALIRLKTAGTKLRRTVKLALTCGEETPGDFDGAEWLAKNHKDWIDAEFALNEGGGGSRYADGRPKSLGMQAGEKVFQDFRLEATNAGGHSSVPRPDNAIYQLSAALLKVGAYEFPVQFTDTTRLFFKERGKIEGGETEASVNRLLANPADTAANAIVSRDPRLHSMLRTTCVATLLEGGHADNALPQRARANVNCRMFPGDPVEGVRAQLVKAIGDAGVAVTAVPPLSPTPPPPPLTPLVYGTAVDLAKKMFPGVPMLPTMSTGATDGRFLTSAGIPTYGVPGSMGDPDGNGVHGLNERTRVDGLYQQRDYLFELIKLYANSK